MKFSTRATYGLKAMLYLADHYGESAVPVSQIANEEGISAAYLEQILNRLKKESWVKSVRGPHGGYVLTKKPGEISVAAVLNALEEGVRVSAGSDANTDRQRKRPVAHQASDAFWKNLSESFVRTLESVTLHQLISGVSSAGTGKSAVHPDLTFNI